jgi:hypothetical protein
VARDFLRDFNPDVRISGGDVFDLRWLRKSAKDDEKAQRISDDLEAGFAFLSWYKPTVFLWGNHDVRLKDAEANESDGPLRHLAGQTIDRLDVQLGKAKQFPYCKRRGIFHLADFAFGHGYTHGQNAVRKAGGAYGNFIMGHVHRTESISFEGLDTRVAHSVGCLCQTDMDYNRAAIDTLRQNNGFAYGVVTPQGRLCVWHARPIGGTWVFPSEIRAVTPIDDSGRLSMQRKRSSMTASSSRSSAAKTPSRKPSPMAGGARSR